MLNTYLYYTCYYFFSYVASTTYCITYLVSRFKSYTKKPILEAMYVCVFKWMYTCSNIYFILYICFDLSPSGTLANKTC